MNRLMWVSLLLLVSLLGCSPDTAIAEVGGPGMVLNLDTATPRGLQRIANGFHVLDNGTPSSFFDVQDGKWLGGITTQIYKAYYLSFDLGGAYALESSASAQFLTGLRWYPGEWAMDHLARFKDFVNENALRQGLVKYMAGGIFYSRDWTNKENRWGPYAGVEFRFY